jgi:hypothetical protein
MPIGAGLFPAGLFPAGFGQPEQAGPPATALLPDPSTGQTQTGRLINQQTGDYVFTADGRLEGMATVSQLVLLAIKNIDLSQIQQKGPGFERALAARVQAAVADLVTRGLVQIISVVQAATSNPDAGIAVLTWRDLTQGQASDVINTPIGTP